MAYGRVYTTRELVAEYGKHIGGERACQCCGRYLLYRIVYSPDLSVVLCSDCDTERT